MEKFESNKLRKSKIIKKKSVFPHAIPTSSITRTTPMTTSSSSTTTTGITTNTSTTTALSEGMTTVTNCRNSKNTKNQFSRTTSRPSSAADAQTKASSNIYSAFHATNSAFRQLLPVATFLVLAAITTFGFSALPLACAEEFYASTTPINVAVNETAATATATSSSSLSPSPPHDQATEEAIATFWQSGTEHWLNGTDHPQLKNSTLSLSTTSSTTTTTTSSPPWRHKSIQSEAGSSFFSRYATRVSSGNELWDGIIADCYQRPTFSCFQKNVYAYLTDALEASDVNVTQRLKFFRNQVDYEAEEESWRPVTEAAAAKDGSSVESGDGDDDDGDVGEDAHLANNEIPQQGRSTGDTPIEEVTNALYSKSVKFAMTHDIELQLPEVMFDGATFRISPRSMEGNGVIAKLELIPKQEVEARLAGKILMKKIHKFLRSKLLLSFLALVLIIKIIKIKLFWLLPVVIGVGAAKKLLLKFLLFLFPALSHLFKLCSYYQQTYHHSTKYHHHHHLINHHHTIVPSWHNSDHHSIPEVIYTNPPKGHPSAYLHGAPIHETYSGPISSHEHYDDAWVNSGPGLGTEYISDINRVAQIDENSNYFKPHTANDANELHSWGLGPMESPSSSSSSSSSIRQSQRVPATQQQRPPTFNKQQQQHHSSSHGFNPFINPDKQSAFNNNLKLPIQQQQQQQQSMPSPVYTPPRNTAAHMMGGSAVAGLNAAQIAAQYEPARHNPQNPHQQQQLQQQQQPPLQSPQLSAQLKEALRIQAEQRIVAQQQKILEKQPFVQDGQPIMPKNYDPFYSPILLKIDKILEQLGVKDELCKERLVCSMYKDPNRYSPHSNFVSAELSRDTTELQPVTSTNPAVVRFYRLIQAARDGQDEKDCLRLYPQCNINTE